MHVDLNTILPNVAHSLDGTGFLFGAGTSYEAGYPMMPELTRQVVGGLTVADRAVLDEVLVAAGQTYDDLDATPNIEHVADLVIAHSTNSGDRRFTDLENRLRDLILDIILGVKDPQLDTHCRFFESLKKHAFGLPCSIWIFTTNYDLLIETAASCVGVRLENGFSGATERFFCPALFRSTIGEVNGSRFTPTTTLTVNLVKLHGSISWIAESSNLFERHPAALRSTVRRVMVLPRRKKVMETLAPPYDSLFALTSKVIGSECKYLVSCGFGFGDDHINQQLLLPAMRANKCRLFALCEEEPSPLDAYKPLSNFGAGFDSHLHKDGKSVAGATDAWRFSTFVNLFG